ncbi:hypothetical protein K8O68_07055 [Salipaludibacillus sp. CUR1]|uniref:hypothetical protein n=1 Tax=Salipaludibacillus sp. CUR1 TaxID=2820003 RepID=UPI001E3A3073|nr:hypothetical protein [Salipaludibacillus sp. CUR1]MCE7792182.1 hypothetical protein [Salipaludibacillus sp. CUR1]
MNEYSRVLGVEKEKDRRMVFRIIDYLCYALFVLTLTAFFLPVNVFPEIVTGTIFIWTLAIYLGSKAIEGLVDKKMRMALFFGPTAILCLGLGIFLLVLL